MCPEFSEGTHYVMGWCGQGEALGHALLRLAVVMFRSCGQLIDPFGSQGEQIQQTNFGQSGDMSNVFTMRGGYSEHRTVFWMTARGVSTPSRSLS